MSIKKVILPNKKVRWEVQARLPSDPSRKIKRRFLKKIEAELFLKSFLKRKNEVKSSSLFQEAPDIETVLFKDETEFWFKQKESEFTHGYLRVVKPALKRFILKFGHLKISRFTPDFLLEFRQSLKQDGLSPSTQNRYTDLIVRIINFSYEQRRINHNPTIGYKKVREYHGDIKFWSEDEALKFLSFADQKYPVKSKKRWIYVSYLLALETGMRAREIWGLKVSDLHQAEFKIKVSRQAVTKDQTSLTKGKKPRFVPLSDGLKDELAFLLNGSLESPLFKSQNGNMIDHINFKRRVFDKDLKESGLPRIRFHDLRHTAITMMVRRGVILPVVQKIAGHANIKTTMRYVHVIGKDVDEVARSFSLRPQNARPKLSLVTS